MALPLVGETFLRLLFEKVFFSADLLYVFLKCRWIAYNLTYQVMEMFYLSILYDYMLEQLSNPR